MTTVGGRVGGRFVFSDLLLDFLDAPAVRLSVLRDLDVFFVTLVSVSCGELDGDKDEVSNKWRVSQDDCEV